MNPPNFLAELKRRNVIRVAGLYLVGAWLIVQVAGTCCRSLMHPTGSVKTSSSCSPGGSCPR